MDIMSEIFQKKAATIMLSELEQLCKSENYDEFAADVNKLIDSGIISPMGSKKDTNGMFPPLRRRYRIVHIKEDMTDIRNEILLLGPDFNPSGYLSNISLYIRHRELVMRLREYVCTHGGELVSAMSRNERAYAIWGNEKQFDDNVCKSMLRFTGWENRLNYYATPEPFFDYLCGASETRSILILENKDIWFSLRKLFMEKKSACKLFGQYFDGLLYGEGNKISRPGALEEYSAEGFSAPPSFFYLGDLDYVGIAIFTRISLPSVTPFVPGYEAMLRYSGERELTPCRTNQTVPPHMDSFFKHFDDASARNIYELLKSGFFIPQEILNSPRLRAAISEAL